MSSTEFWFWIWIAIIAGLTITSMGHSISQVFYYRYESKRQIEVAKATGKETTKP